MDREQRDIDQFTRHIAPYVRYFYRAAYAIVADRPLAERTLTDALVRSYLKNAVSSSVGLKDAVLTHIRAAAFERLDGEAPSGEWTGLGPAQKDDDLVIHLLKEEGTLSQRIVVLRYGCAMTNREIAHVLDMDDDVVRETLSAVRSRIERALKKQTGVKSSYDRLCMKAVRREMNREGRDRIDVGYLIAALEKELSGRRRPRRTLVRVIKIILFVLFGFICAALIWVIGVLTLM